jgi:hypothetical protein
VGWNEPGVSVEQEWLRVGRTSVCVMRLGDDRSEPRRPTEPDDGVSGCVWHTSTRVGQDVRARSITSLRGIAAPTAC